MQKTHFNTINSISRKYISILAPNLDFNDNVGSLFRLADSMGVKHLYFGNTVDLNNRKIKKTARSTQTKVLSTSNVNPEDIINHFLENNCRVVGIEITDDSTNMKALKIKDNEEVLLIIGNENNGINSDLLKLIPEKYHIEMYGENSSMNVISATSMALFQIQNN